MGWTGTGAKADSLGGNPHLPVSKLSIFPPPGISSYQCGGCLLVWELENEACYVPGKPTSHEWAPLVRSVYESPFHLGASSLIQEKWGHHSAKAGGAEEQVLTSGLGTSASYEVKRGRGHGGSHLTVLACGR